MLSRPARRHVALLALVAALAGCGGDGGPKRASPDETHWLERLADWEDATGRADEGVGEVYLAILAGDEGQRSRLDEVTRPIRECRARLATSVGPAPSPRFRRGYALLRSACGHYERSARALERSFGRDPGTALQEMETQRQKGAEVFAGAHRAIEERLTANRHLERIGGVTAVSRIEPRLSRAASAIARRPVEVACWSRSEWPRVVDEWGAYIGTDEIGAFAQVNTNRVSLAPETCADLVAFTEDGERPARGRALDAVAYGVVVLTHEAEHVLNEAGTEAETECYAMQAARQTARSLGADAAYADRLIAHYWLEVYPAAPAEYRTGDCVDGGVLDANPRSSRWP